MKIDKAYDRWAATYDSNDNKTRDMDRLATREMLAGYEFDRVVELGCGTGKNTSWFLDRARSLIALDLSEGMLARARQKIDSNKVQFLQADITKAWPVPDAQADLLSCNLILEHVSDLNFIFRQAFQKLKEQGLFFISELHPFKQYLGSKARFETEDGVEVLEVYVHHVSEFVGAALGNGFRLLELREWFDEGAAGEVPRLLSMVFRKQA